MSRDEERLVFTTEDGEQTAFYVLDQTTLGGVNYLLVTDSQSDEANALILKEKTGGKKEEAVYDVVEDDTELLAVARVFEELLDDIEIETE